MKRIWGGIKRIKGVTLKTNDILYYKKYSYIVIYSYYITLYNNIQCFYHCAQEKYLR